MAALTAHSLQPNALQSEKQAFPGDCWGDGTMQWTELAPLRRQEKTLWYSSRQMPLQISSLKMKWRVFSTFMPRSTENVGPSMRVWHHEAESVCPPWLWPCSEDHQRAWLTVTEGGLLSPKDTVPFSSQMNFCRVGLLWVDVFYSVVCGPAYVMAYM